MKYQKLSNENKKLLEEIKKYKETEKSKFKNKKFQIEQILK